MTVSRNFLYLSGETLAGLGITTANAVDAIERLLVGMAEGSVWSAPKAVITPPDGRYMMATLSAADDPRLLVVKSVVLNPENTQKGLEQINGLIMVLDSETGLPVAVMDGNWITAVRTAALSAVAAKHMARADSSTIAFIGCGVQARSHLDAFAELYPLTRVQAFGRGGANIEALCSAARDRGLDAVASATPQEAVSNADIIVSSVTLTGEMDPFVDAHWLKPGAFATITDILRPWKKDTLDAFDRVTIDDLEQEAGMAQKLLDPALVSGDLAGLAQKKFSGRDNEQQRTAFVFRAHPIGDFALAALAYEKASATSGGLSISD